MMNIHQTYCDNCFMIYVSQIIKLYTLNLYKLYVNYISINQKGERTHNRCLRPNLSCLKIKCQVDL